MQRLVPAILDAWREADRAYAAEGASPEERARLAERIHVLQSAHAMALEPQAERDAVVQFLREHDAADVVGDTDSVIEALEKDD